MTVSISPDREAPNPNVPGVPGAVAWPARDVAVYQEDADTPGAWIDRSDRLLITRVTHGIDDQAAQFADGLYVFDEASEPMSSGGTFQPDYLSRAVDDLDPNLLIKIELPHPDPDGNKVMFLGYPTNVQPSWGDNPEDPQEGLSFTLTGVANRLDTDPQCAVIGRYVHGNILQGEDPGGPGGSGGASGSVSYTEVNLRLLQSQPCIFNEFGKPNRSPRRVAVTVETATGSLAIQVPVFAPRLLKKEESLDVKQWTFASAYLYLWYFYAVKPYADAGEPLPVDPDLSLLLRLNILADADPLPDPLVIAEPFRRAMLTAPNSLAIDGTMLFTALQMLMRASDTHLDIVYVAGQPTAHFQVTNQGPLIDLTRSVPRTAIPADQVASVTLDQNKAMAVTFTYDHTKIVNAPIVVGGVRRYEITVELVPAWKPVTDLDTVDPNDLNAVENAKKIWRPLGGDQIDDADIALGQFMRSHPVHVYSTELGRKWALNESGAYDAATYARQYPPFDNDPSGDNAYAAFDFSEAGIRDRVIGPDGQVVLQSLAPGAWARVPRPFRNPLTRRSAGQSRPFVEVSFESGAEDTWHPITAWEPSEVEAAITFATESPFEIMPPTRVEDGVRRGVNGWWDDNMFYSIIAGTFRVRVTASVEGDGRLISGPVANDVLSPVDRLVTRVFDRSEFQYNLSDEADSVLSQEDLESEDSMHLIEINAFRKAIAQALADRTVSVNPQVPWLDTGFSIGDRIEGVGGVGLSAEMRSADEPVYPQIVGLVFHLEQSNQFTEIIVGDFRHAPEARVDQE